jgi:hypothetical protein
MKECVFESDVLDALASHRWPAKAGDELRAHVAGCESCHSLAITASALMSEQETAYAEARVPSSAAVWHRAQLRAREEAVRTATRPIGFVQGVAFAFGLALALGAAAWGLPLLAPLLPDVSSLLAWVSAPAPALDAADGAWLLSNTVVQVALAGWLLLVPAALYFALARD